MAQMYFLKSINDDWHFDFKLELFRSSIWGSLLFETVFYYKAYGIYLCSGWSASSGVTSVRIRSKELYRETTFIKIMPTDSSSSIMLTVDNLHRTSSFHFFTKKKCRRGFLWLLLWKLEFMRIFCTLWWVSPQVQNHSWHQVEL